MAIEPTWPRPNPCSVKTEDRGPCRAGARPAPTRGRKFQPRFLPRSSRHRRWVLRRPYFMLTHHRMALLSTTIEAPLGHLARAFRARTRLLMCSAVAHALCVLCFAQDGLPARPAYQTLRQNEDRPLMATITPRDGRPYLDRLNSMQSARSPSPSSKSPKRRGFV